MNVNCCRGIKLYMFPWIYKLGENSKRNYDCFHYIKFPCSEFEMNPMRFSFFFLFFNFRKIVPHVRAFFIVAVLFCILAIFWFQLRLFEVGKSCECRNSLFLFDFFGGDNWHFLAPSLDFSHFQTLNRAIFTASFNF